MIYLLSANLSFLVVSLLIGLATGWWIWGRRRHRIVYITPDAADAPLARTLERQQPPMDTAPMAPPPAPAPVVRSGGPFLAAPEGQRDDLSRIKGIGPKLATRLDELGVFHYRQIAGWTPADLVEVDSYLGTFKGRIERDRWQSQARLLAAGDDDDFELEFGPAQS
jgi:predicted flap endonuclease-1-like 5' DNA nuclease